MVVGRDLEEKREVREDSVGKVMKHAAQVSCLWCKASLDRWLHWGLASTLQPACSLQLSLVPSFCLYPYLFFLFSCFCHLSLSLFLYSAAPLLLYRYLGIGLLHEQPCHPRHNTFFTKVTAAHYFTLENVRWIIVGLGPKFCISFGLGKTATCV